MWNADARDITSIWKYYCSLYSCLFERQVLNFIFLIFIFQAEACREWLYWKLSLPWIRTSANDVIEGDKDKDKGSPLKRWFISSNGINVKVYHLFLHLTAFITHPGPTPCSFKWAISRFALHAPAAFLFTLSHWSLSQTPNFDQSFFSPPSKCGIFPWALNNTRLSRYWEVFKVLGGEWEGFTCGKDVNCHGRMSANMAANSSHVCWLCATPFSRRGAYFPSYWHCDLLWPIEHREDATVRSQSLFFF